MSARSRSTSSCEVRLDEHGICWLDFAEPNVVVELEHSQAIVRARTALGASPEAPQLVAVDLSNTPRPTKAARDFTSSVAVASITRAMAMVTPSLLSRVIGNAFLGFSSGPFPTRLFPDAPSAVAWLLEQRRSED